MKDFFGNVPEIVIDKILEKLPIRMAAQSSVLSKQWRRAWLSLQILVFDDFGFKINDSRKRSEIISNILFYHNGPVHDFYLNILPEASDDRMNHNSWISFLSKNGVRKIEMADYAKVDITSNIFRCTELVHLKLTGFRLNHPPTDFSGFPNLKHLELWGIEFRKQNVFGSWIENCRKLETLILTNWSGLDHVVIDAPSLQTLLLGGSFESLAFRNIGGLKSISMCLVRMPEEVRTVETVDAVSLLANSCQLQSIMFNGRMCKFLATGGNMRSTSVTFNHLDELRLTFLNLNDFTVFRYLLSMIECCPYIKLLDILLIQGGSIGQHVLDLDFNHNYKLIHLRKVEFFFKIGLFSKLFLVLGLVSNYFFSMGPRHHISFF